jgi:hypothetical protein
VAYEGEDEFSMMSLDPSRRQVQKKKQGIAPNAPGQRDQVKVDELKATNEGGVLSLFRKIFAK